MILKLNDDMVKGDEIFGPMPNFNLSFETFFINKAACSLYSAKIDQTNNQTEDTDGNVEHFNSKLIKFIVN